MSQVFKPHLPNLETLLSANEKALAEDHLSLAKEDDQLLERFLYRQVFIYQLKSLQQKIQEANTSAMAWKHLV